MNRIQQPAPPPPRPHFDFRPPPVRATAPLRPRTVTVSLALWVAAVSVSVAAAVFVLVNKDVLQAELLAQAQQQFPTATPGRTERVVNAALLVLLGLWGVLAALTMGSAIALRSRRRAKVARLVLLPLWLLSVLHGAVLLGVTPMPVPVLQVGALTVGLAAIVVTFLPSGNDWFSRQGRGR